MSDGLRRVLITGANGLVGSQFPKINTGEFEIVYSSRSKPRFSFNGPFHSIDFNETAGISEFLDQVNPDIIIHTAGVTAIDYAAKNPEETIRVNVEATYEIVTWCRSKNARLILFSTDFVFDGIAGSYSESDQTAPISIYGKSKLQAEQTVINRLTDFAIVRTSLVYGFNQNLARLSFPVWLKERLENGNAVDITDDQTRSPIYALDLAQMTLSLARSNRTGIYNLAGPQEFNVLDFAYEIAETFGLDKSLISGVKTKPMRDEIRRPLNTSLKTIKANEDLNFKALKVRDGLISLHYEILSN
jgi:dTDP-4-dehydrorhamnose reductase